jgi:hypothetical protein
MGVLSETCTFFKSYLGEETLLQERGLFFLYSTVVCIIFGIKHNSNALRSAVDLNFERFKIGSGPQLRKVF